MGLRAGRREWARAVPGWRRGRRRRLVQVELVHVDQQPAVLKLKRASPIRPAAVALVRVDRQPGRVVNRVTYSASRIFPAAVALVRVDRQPGRVVNVSRASTRGKCRSCPRLSPWSPSIGSRPRGVEDHPAAVSPGPRRGSSRGRGPGPRRSTGRHGEHVEGLTSSAAGPRGVEDLPCGRGPGPRRSTAGRGEPHRAPAAPSWSTSTSTSSSAAVIAGIAVGKLDYGKFSSLAVVLHGEEHEDDEGGPIEDIGEADEPIDDAMSPMLPPVFKAVAEDGALVRGLRRGDPQAQRAHEGGPRPGQRKQRRTPGPTTPSAQG